MLVRSIAVAGFMLSASAAFAAATTIRAETPTDIYNRCGVTLYNPNAIVAASGAPCSAVEVIGLMEPKEQPSTNDDSPSPEVN